MFAAPSASHTWAAVYAKAAPGTVDITVDAIQPVPTPFGERSEETTVTGSGFVVDGRGHIVTTERVVDGAQSINVTFDDGGPSRGAKIIGRSGSSDLALLRVDAASGGPILTPDGRVVGISDQIATGTGRFGRSNSDTSTGVGFAIPSDLARAGLPLLLRGSAG